MNFVSYGDLTEILSGIAQKTPQGIMLADTLVGYVTWQMAIKQDYIELNGATLADAKTDYADLLEYAVRNNLVTSDTTQIYKFRYDSASDALTIPDFSGVDLSVDLIPQIRYKKSESVWNLLEWWGLTRNKVYAVNDVAYTKSLPSYLRLECTVAGTTAAVEPDFTGVTAGQYVTDGTAVFIVCDIRDCLAVGDFKLAPVLRDGYVQANGGLLSAASVNYPRLVAFVTANTELLAADDTAWASNKALYVYDSTNDTLRVPDLTGRVLQGGSSITSVEAGLPNITGAVNTVVSGQYAREITGTGGALEAQQTYSNLGRPSAPTRYSGTTGIKLDASLSNSIYGNSTTVQPPALTLIPQIKY